MKVLIIGSEGFIGKNLKFFLKDKKINFFEISKKNNQDIFDKIKKSDFIIHLADKIKSKHKSDFDNSLKFTKHIISLIKKNGKKKYFIYTSSINLKKKNNFHYNLKRKSEKLLSSENLIESFILRLPNIFGKWCKPNYNSFFATACHNISMNKKLKILSQKKISLVHISDLCEYILEIIKIKKINNIKFEKNYLKLSPKDIQKILLSFKKKKEINLFKEYNLRKKDVDKIYSTFLFYNNQQNFYEKIKTVKDIRGHFTELVKAPDFGQISLLTVNPNQERGNHFHNNKIEKFFVISGKGKLMHQNVINKKVKIFNISDTDNKFYYTIPGWSHKIKNDSSKKLIILIYSNEVYNKHKSDTIKCQF